MSIRWVTLLMCIFCLYFWPHQPMICVLAVWRMRLLKMLFWWMEYNAAKNWRLLPSEELLGILIDATLVSLGAALLFLVVTLLWLMPFVLSKIASASLVLVPDFGCYLENDSLCTCNFAFSLAKISCISISSIHFDCFHFWHA